MQSVHPCASINPSLLNSGSFTVDSRVSARGGSITRDDLRFPLFPGQNEMDQIQKIHNVLGTPSPDLLASKFKRRTCRVRTTAAAQLGS